MLVEEKENQGRIDSLLIRISVLQTFVAAQETLLDQMEAAGDVSGNPTWRPCRTQWPWGPALNPFWKKALNMALARESEPLHRVAAPTPAPLPENI